ncbi:PilZ domain-containing protein [Stakelama marina]|uniref:PilZ domain-containing protein n=1 Tax=Stakelama marina TaxID=2826939 RepID=A0A8T4IC48_9SPHN|nr:PilZ domain-containing protein [Stakelama marina]MBR0551961.1 PilZ domain-containing protein [Stakelama marina]
MQPANARREIRHNVFLSALVERFGAKETSKHRVRNISRNGACIDTAQAFKRGETVLITVGDLECVGSTVRWIEGSRAGVQFAMAIDISSATAKTVIRSEAMHAEQQGDKPRFTFAR